MNMEGSNGVSTGGSIQGICPLSPKNRIPLLEGSEFNEKNFFIL